ncbi:competence/damage-inducible protein A [Sphingomonas alba]|uniref:Molybdopterin-binding protein n=1 Tax=Sphingomonas alba TaxID=2908208 RepID=A0ABT0RI25_9SPHN|nr:molybdopterin-binding protein [Sphingomonas alba]MCL6682293.1 molybdopterin-binding protein [Sphingomonas alba]
MEVGELGESRVWTAALVVIGDEILSGRTQDRNIAQVATWLNVQGIRLAEVRVVPDVEDRIAEAIAALRSAHDYLFTTGGIGPTHDDITVDSIAKALGVGVVVHPEAWAILEKYYADKGGVTDARLRMARVPEGAELIRNYLSGAPGIRLGNIFILAGVPHICAGMLDALTGTLEGGRPLVSVTVGAWAPESEVADLLRQAERANEGVAIGSYPFFKQGKVGANFVVRSEEEQLARKVAGDLENALASAGYDPVEGGI